MSASMLKTTIAMRHHDQERHHRVGSTSLRPVDEQRAHALPAEDGLGDDGAADHRREVKAIEGGDRDQRRCGSAWWTTTCARSAGPWPGPCARSPGSSSRASTPAVNRLYVAKLISASARVGSDLVTGVVDHPLPERALQVRRLRADRGDRATGRPRRQEMVDHHEGADDHGRHHACRRRPAGRCRRTRRRRRRRERGQHRSRASWVQLGSSSQPRTRTRPASRRSPPPSRAPGLGDCRDRRRRASRPGGAQRRRARGPAARSPGCRATAGLMSSEDADAMPRRQRRRRSTRRRFEPPMALAQKAP